MQGTDGWGTDGCCVALLAEGNNNLSCISQVVYYVLQITHILSKHACPIHAHHRSFESFPSSEVPLCVSQFRANFWA